jgi:hypothetical protein
MKQFYNLLTIAFLVCMCTVLKAQNLSYTVENYSFKPVSRIRVSEIRDDWMFSINTPDVVVEGNHAYRYFLQELKRESAARYPRKEAELRTGVMETNNSSLSSDTPVVHRNFQGNIYSGSAPNDNTLAVSNGGQLISAINTNVYFYDLSNDSLMKAITLNKFASGLTGISTHQYDPKLLYDPEQDRFILVFLAGSSSDATKLTNIVVAFSKTNDMMGDWNLYALPGNPLNDTSWTDFPSIAVTKDELFITGNLLDYGTSWQTSFRQTIIWQVNKFNGYSGENLSTRLWKDIVFDGANIRNINPIQGGEALTGPNLYLLSNRNFTIYSDSVFLIEVTGNLKNENAQLKIQYLKANPGYGAPPDAKQPNSNDRLATNDARVLGGFIRNNTIQYVANTIDTTTGRAVIYHGIITHVGSRPEIKGTLITEPLMEFGYPNISYTGNTLFSQQSIIGFNHTGDSVFPGVSVIGYNGAGAYSKRVTIRQGADLINIFTSTYERWGDYTGNQRKYNEPGKIWMSGMLGIKVGMSRKLATQIAEVTTGIVEDPIRIKGEKLEAALYPNPLSDQFGMEFDLDSAMNLVIDLRSMSGQLEHRFFHGNILPGHCSFTFNTAHLSKGTHMVMITTIDGTLLFMEKIVKI